MAYDYNKLYGTTRDALGSPTLVFVDFFDRFEHKNARILDVGCGQGRDTLFIARLGHSVVGVDISPNGIRDLEAAAEKENLSVQGVVADITTYAPEGEFEAILIDRTLHMLPQKTRIAVLTALLDHVADRGWLLIADEPSNIHEFEAAITAHGDMWQTQLRQRGYLFVRRVRTTHWVEKENCEDFQRD